MHMYLTPADAARILNVTPATVRQMVAREELPVAARTESGIRLFDKGDVIRLRDRRERKGG